MDTEQVAYDDARWRIRLTVGEDTIEAEMVRSQLQADAQAAIKAAADAGEPMPPHVQVLVAYFYPRLMAVTRKGVVQRLNPGAPAEGDTLSGRIPASAVSEGVAEVAEVVRTLPWPVPFEVFRDLPRGLWDPWEGALQRINPHLIPPPVSAVQPATDAQVVTLPRDDPAMLALDEAQKKVSSTTPPS